MERSYVASADAFAKLLKELGNCTVGKPRQALKDDFTVSLTWFKVGGEFIPNLMLTRWPAKYGGVDSTVMFVTMMHNGDELRGVYNQAAYTFPSVVAGSIVSFALYNKT